MKMYELDLTKYKVIVQKAIQGSNGYDAYENVEDIYPMRRNLSDFLRMPGIFKSGEEIVEAITLAKSLRDLDDNEKSVTLDEREAEILKIALNRIIALTAEGKAAFGGPVHEEMICRAFGMKEV